MASSAVHQHIILIMVGEVKQIPVQAGRLNASLYVRRKTSSGQWASGKTKSSTSTPFHMRSQILALLHRVNSLFVWNGSERMCLSRRSDSCPHREFNRALTWVVPKWVSCILGKPTAKQVISQSPWVSSLPAHEFCPNWYTACKCFR